MHPPSLHGRVQSRSGAGRAHRALAALAAHYQLSTTQITRWKLQLREQAAQVSAEALAALAPVADVEPLYAAIGRLQMENALLKKTLGPCQ